MKITKSLNYNFLSLLTFAITTSTCCLILSSCSSTASGKGSADGDSSITDEDLALGGANGNKFGDGNIPTASSKTTGNFQDIFFGYDSDAIDPEYNEMLKESAADLSSNPGMRVEVEGHSDKRGTNEYNLALGEERAKSAARMLVQYGASSSQVSTISYGEEIPLDPGNSESAFAKNRRVHFALSKNNRKN